MKTTQIHDFLATLVIIPFIYPFVKHY
jgi:hypothetical protein